MKEYTNHWIHLVVNFKNNKLQSQLYVNGKMICDNFSNDIIQPISADRGKLFIGSGLLGKMDDIMIFKKALAPQEVIDLYHLPTCCR